MSERYNNVPKEFEPGMIGSLVIMITVTENTAGVILEKNEITTRVTLLGTIRVCKSGHRGSEELHVDAGEGGCHLLELIGCQLDRIRYRDNACVLAFSGACVVDLYILIDSRYESFNVSR